MPYAPKKACTHPGCSSYATRGGRCDSHQYQFKRHKTGPRPYDRQAWRRLRKIVLGKNPLCACGCGRWATDVDHINGDPTDNRMGNLQALAHECHSRKTAKEDGGFTGHRGGGIKSSDIAR